MISTAVEQAASEGARTTQGPKGPTAAQKRVLIVHMQLILFCPSVQLTKVRNGQKGKQAELDDPKTCLLNDQWQAADT